MLNPLCSSGGPYGWGFPAVKMPPPLRGSDRAPRRSGVYNIALLKTAKSAGFCRLSAICGKRNTGTSVHFVNFKSFFDSPFFLLSRLVPPWKQKRAAVSQRGNHFKDEVNNSESSAGAAAALTETTIWRSGKRPADAAGAVCLVILTVKRKLLIPLLWPPEGGELLTESYVAT